MKKRTIVITAICILLICGFIAAMGFGNEENNAANAAMDYLNGRDYFELDENEKESLYNKISHLEFERLKKKRKLLIQLDPSEKREQSFESATYDDNLYQIECDLRTYGYMAEIYGDEYLRFSIIDSNKEDIKYMKLMLDHMEREIIDCKFVFTEPVGFFLNYINVRKKNLNKDLLARFEKVDAFYHGCIYVRIVEKTPKALRELCNYLITRCGGIPDMKIEEDRRYAYERINLMLQALEDSIDKNEILEEDYASAFFTYMHYTQEVMDEEMLARYKAVYDFYYPIYGSEEQGYGTVDWKPSLMLFIK